MLSGDAPFAKRQTGQGTMLITSYFRIKGANGPVKLVGNEDLPPWIPHPHSRRNRYPVADFRLYAGAGHSAAGAGSI